MSRRGGLVLKLPRDRVAGLVASGDGTTFDAGKGKPMKEWVVVRKGSNSHWLSLAEEALAFVGGGRSKVAVSSPHVDERSRSLRPGP